MTRRDAPFEVGEWYHCYNSSIDKKVAFADLKDYQRILELLYLANDETPLRRNDIGIHRFDEILRIPRGEPLVAIGAFCLMQSHFHLILQEITPGGITTFMRKLGTAYTLYFNSRYGREGNLFKKPFRSLQVSKERYALAVSYVHANPTVLYEPEWKRGHVVDHQFVVEHLVAYPYASLGSYAGGISPIRAILAPEALAEAGRTIQIEAMLREARTYSAELDIP